MMTRGDRQSARPLLFPCQYPGVRSSHRYYFTPLVTLPCSVERQRAGAPSHLRSIMNDSWRVYRAHVNETRVGTPTGRYSVYIQ